MSDNKLTAYLADHPRMIGALFMLTMLLSQVGAVAAANGSTCGGP